MNPNRQVIKPPDLGSFPLDHFHDCNTEAAEYSSCMARHQMMPKRCRQWQKKYLECRMKRGLMDEKDINSLGLGPELDWDNEEQERKVTFDKIQEIKMRAMHRAQEKYPPKPSNESAEKPPTPNSQAKTN